MASSPIKVAMLVNDLGINGISTVIMNYCRNLDMKQFQVTIVAGAPIAPLYRSECEALGIKWCLLPERKTSPGAYSFLCFPEKGLILFMSMGIVQRLRQNCFLHG